MPRLPFEIVVCTFVDYLCERLSTITEEYKKTEKRFNDSMEKSHKIVSIERVQNLELWIQYAQ